MYEPYVKSNPEKPNIPINLFFRGIFFLSFALILGFIKDRKDFVFHSIREIQEDLNVPILGNVPYIKFIEIDENEDITLDQIDEGLKNINKNDKNKNYERFIYQESLRSIFTSIKFLNTDNKQIISLSSCIPKEIFMQYLNR